VSMFEEPGAGKSHAGICAGDAGEPAFLLRRTLKIKAYNEYVPQNMNLSKV